MERRRKKVGRLVFILFLFFFTILVVLFFQSSISKVQEIHVTGTDKLNDQDLVMQSGILIGDQILLIRENKIRELLLQNPIIKDVKLEIDFPGSVTLHVTEFQTVAYLFNDQHRFHPILENGFLFEQDHQELIDHPIITEWNDLSLLPNFCKELTQLNTMIQQQISEIRLVPSDNDPYKLILYMRDGYEVHTSIIQFAKYLKNYLYVVENLNESEAGVINLSDAGVYYISYKEIQDSSEEQLKEEVNEEQE